MFDFSYKDDQACQSLSLLFQIKMKKVTEFAREVIEFFNKQIREEVIELFVIMFDNNS
jgi:hypothetical protein